MPRALAVLMLAALAACEREPLGPAPDPATSWSVDPATVSLAVGESVEVHITFLAGSEVLDVRRLTHSPRVYLNSDCGWAYPCAVTVGYLTPAPDYLSYRFTVTGVSPAVLQLELKYGYWVVEDLCQDPPECSMQDRTWVQLLPPLVLAVEVR